MEEYKVAQEQMEKPILSLILKSLVIFFLILISYILFNYCDDFIVYRDFTKKVNKNHISSWCNKNPGEIYLKCVREEFIKYTEIADVDAIILANRLVIKIINMEAEKIEDKKEKLLVATSNMADLSLISINALNKYDPSILDLTINYPVLLLKRATIRHFKKTSEKSVKPALEQILQEKESFRDEKYRQLFEKIELLKKNYL